MKEMIKLLSNLEWFLKMVNENPDLPVIPIVSDEVIDDDFKLISYQLILIRSKPLYKGGLL